MAKAWPQERPTRAPLREFLRWFINDGPRFGAVPWAMAVTDIYDVTGILWYRAPPFQVQLFAVPADYIIPEHTHPNVDSVELYLGGQIMFSRRGRWVQKIDLTGQPKADGTNYYQGRQIRVRPNDIHGAAIGPAGGVFMSIQHWQNDVEPDCVSKDYDGIALAPDHTAETGTVVHRGRSRAA